ncbi:hypothetical protein BDW75DRAFT_201998 [Aspergillus navahoensis]
MLPICGVIISTLGLLIGACTSTSTSGYCQAFASWCSTSITLYQTSRTSEKMRHQCAMRCSHVVLTQSGLSSFRWFNSMRLLSKGTISNRN